MTWRSALAGWAIALAAFLIGEYGGGALANLLGGDVRVAWSWLPWIGGPALAGISVGLLYPYTSETRWWHWIVLAVPVPLGAFIVTYAYFGTRDVPGEVMNALTGALPAASAVQLGVAIALTLGIGLARSALTRDTRPASHPLFQDQ